VTTDPVLVAGTVLVWHDEDGWGVLRAPDGTQVWCHYSFIEVGRPGDYKSLHVGETVRFDYEVPGQDGYPARVRSIVRRSG
jgi:cold shock CspA family protein